MEQFFFVPVGLYVTSKILKKDYLEVLDFYAPYILLTLGLMRIGCYLGGCCGAHRIIFMHKQIVPPIQLIELILDIILFIYLITSHEKHSYNIKGILYPKVMIGYSFIRLIMENYRDTPKDVIGMSRGQWYSIISFLIGVYTISIIKKNHYKKNKKNN